MTVSLHEPWMAAFREMSSITAPGVRRPARPVQGRVRRAHACDGVLAGRRTGVQGWLAVRLVAVVALMVAGFGVSVAEMVSWVQPDPAIAHVQGDPAWAHVDGVMPQP